MSRWILVLLTKAVLKNKDRRILSPRKASVIPEAAEKAGRLLHAAFTGCQHFRAEKGEEFMMTAFETI